MPNFLAYNPEQAYLLPPTVRDVLGEDHLCFFVHRAVERLDLSAFEQEYSEEGHPAYHPALLLKVWLYAYALGVTSSRRLRVGLTHRTTVWSPAPLLSAMSADHELLVACRASVRAGSAHGTTPAPVLPPSTSEPSSSKKLLDLRIGLKEPYLPLKSYRTLPFSGRTCPLLTSSLPIFRERSWPKRT